MLCSNGEIVSMLVVLTRGVSGSQDRCQTNLQSQPHRAPFVDGMNWIIGDSFT